MGQFFDVKVWLEDREIDVLKKYDFSEEVMRDDIDVTDRWIVTDIRNKGFLLSGFCNGKEYYQGCGGYRQIFDK